MIRAVIWDMGGIMFRYFTELMLDLGGERNWPLDRLALGPTGPLADPAYEDMLEGRIDEPEYLGIVVERLRSEGIDFDPPRDLDWTDQSRPESWAVIHRIHDEGLRQGLLTNDATKWLGERWWETWEPAGWFDALVDVVTLGVRKPAPEPYLAAARALGVEPAGCLFVDDMPVNCRGAETVGMASHRFDITRPRESLDGLVRRLGLDER
ncbi:MAG: HAD-IA family hydrolase [Acidimicrobiia bacterium]